MPRTFKPGPVKLKRVKRPQLDVTWNQPSRDGTHHRSNAEHASHVSPEHETWNECVEFVNGKSRNDTSAPECSSKSSRANKKSSTNFSRKPNKSSKKKDIDSKRGEEKLGDEKPKGDFNFSLCIMEMLDPLLDQQAEREEEQEGGGYESDDSDFSAMSGVTEAEDDLDDLLMVFRPEMLPVSSTDCAAARVSACDGKPGRAPSPPIVDLDVADPFDMSVTRNRCDALKALSLSNLLVELRCKPLSVISETGDNRRDLYRLESPDLKHSSLSPSKSPEEELSEVFNTDCCQDEVRDLELVFPDAQDLVSEGTSGITPSESIAGIVLGELLDDIEAIQVREPNPATSVDASLTSSAGSRAKMGAQVGDPLKPEMKFSDWKDLLTKDSKDTIIRTMFQETEQPVSEAHEETDLALIVCDSAASDFDVDNDDAMLADFDVPTVSSPEPESLQKALETVRHGAVTAERNSDGSGLDELATICTPDAIGDVMGRLFGSQTPNDKSMFVLRFPECESELLDDDKLTARTPEALVKTSVLRSLVPLPTCDSPVPLVKSRGSKRSHQRLYKIETIRILRRSRVKGMEPVPACKDTMRAPKSEHIVPLEKELLDRRRTCSVSAQMDSDMPKSTFMVLQKLDNIVASYKSARQNMLSVEEFIKRSSFLRSREEKRDSELTAQTGAETEVNNTMDAPHGVSPSSDTHEHSQSPKHDDSMLSDVLLDATSAPTTEDKKRVPEAPCGDGDGPLGRLKASSHRSPQRDSSGSTHGLVSGSKQHAPANNENEMVPANGENSHEGVSQSSSPNSKQTQSLKRAPDDPKLGTPVATKRQKTCDSSPRSEASDGATENAEAAEPPSMEGSDQSPKDASRVKQSHKRAASPVGVAAKVVSVPVSDAEREMDALDSFMALMGAQPKRSKLAAPPRATLTK